MLIVVKDLITIHKWYTYIPATMVVKLDNTQDIKFRKIIKSISITKYKWICGKNANKGCYSTHCIIQNTMTSNANIFINEIITLTLIYLQFSLLSTMNYIKNMYFKDFMKNDIDFFDFILFMFCLFVNILVYVLYVSYI